MENTRPDYIKIFEDIISKRCPHRKKEFDSYLAKKCLSVIEIIEINKKVFGLSDRETTEFNQRHKSYDTETILKMLEYQKKQRLNNLQLASHFKLSRNTVSKWKRLYEKLIVANDLDSAK